MINTTRAFFCDRERYHYDFGECRPGTGWIQYDTDQDASYFGVWIHPELLEVLTFAEGDEIRELCDSREAFREKLDSMEAFYGDPPPAFTTIDRDGKVTHHYEARP